MHPRCLTGLTRDLLVLVQVLKLLEKCTTATTLVRQLQQSKTCVL